MRWRDSVRAALVGGCYFGAAMWLVDAVRSVNSLSGNKLSQVVLGLGGAAFAQLVLAAFLTPLLAVTLWTVGGTSRVLALVTWPLQRREEGSEYVVLGVLSLSLFSVVTWGSLQVVPRLVASNLYRALVEVIILLVFCAWLLAAWGPNAARLRRGWLGELRPTRRGLSVLLLVVTFCTVGLVARQAWSKVSLLPWGVALQLLFALACAGAGGALHTRLRRRRDRRRWLLVGGYVTFSLAGVVSALNITQNDVVAVKLARSVSNTGRFVEPILLWVSDFDDDGQLSYFGGGDCAPNDPKRYLGAVDLPENGIDEDCSGADLKPLGVVKKGRIDWPLPSGLPARPPIVLITIDALSPKHLSAEGYARPTSPNIDALIESGAYFSAAFAQGPSTRLSFPSFFTSHWDSQLEWDLKRRQPYPFKCKKCQLAEFLRQAGYRTVAVLSEGYFSARKWPSITRGFDETHNDWETTKERVPAETVTDQSITVLDGALKDQQPVFLWVHYYDIHSPYEPPPEELAFGSTSKDTYDGQIRRVDVQVGRLVESVRRYAQDALVILASDHATVFHPKPRLRKKKYGYDVHTDTLHIPLLFAAPWIPRGRHDGIVSLMDVVPTIMNLIGYHPKRPLYGESLVPELFEQKRRARLLFHQYHLPEREKKGKDPIAQLGVRSDRHNLIINRKLGSRELYDWRDDYHEMKDLLGESLAVETREAKARLSHAAQSYLYELGVEDQLE